MQKPSSTRIRFPLLVITIFLLLAAQWAGLIRLGWNWSVVIGTLPVSHGPLMVSGFLGTLIGIERAVALGRRWMYFGPGLSAVGGLLLVFDAPVASGALLIFLGSLMLAVVFVVILRIEMVNYTVVMALGTLSWLLGNLLWLLGQPIYVVVYWWAAFLILTIAGERLELGRLLRLSRVSLLIFGLSIVLILAGQLTVLFYLSLGAMIFNLGLLSLALWLLRYDVARVTVRREGLPRFIAWCLLIGYAWLLSGALLGIFNGTQSVGFLYDAYLHTILIGFVFSMIFGHAPIIFPAVLGREAVYKPTLYIPLVFLHSSLLLRLAGDLFSISPLRLWGGLLNALAILLYFAFMGSTLRNSVK